MKKNAVLLTGATGYLGQHLIEALEADKTRTLALVRKTGPGSFPSGRISSAEIVEGSPMEPTAWLDKAKGVKSIVHAAGVVRHSRQSPDDMLRFNVESTRQVVRAAAALDARVVFISSSGTVGCFHHGDLAADEHSIFADAVVSRWPYYASKVRAEREGVQLAKQLGVPFAIVRLPVLLGPNDHRRRSTTHVARVLHDRVPFIPPGGMHFTDVRDASTAIARLATEGGARSIYHLPGTSSSLERFFRTVAEVAGVSFDRPRASKLLIKSIAAIRGRVPGLSSLPDPVVLEMSMCHWGMTSLWSASELGYAPRSARQTLVETIAWLRTQPDPHAAASAHPAHA